MRFFRPVGLVAVLLTTTLCAAATLDEMAEFNGVKFGTPQGQFSGLSEKRAGGEVFYVRGGDELVFAGAPVDALGYQFIDGYFTGVLIFTRDMDRSRALFNALRAQHGEPTQHPRVTDAKVWNGKQARLEFRVLDDSGVAQLRWTRLVRVLGPNGPKVLGAAHFKDYGTDGADVGGDPDGGDTGIDGGAGDVGDAGGD